LRRYTLIKELDFKNYKRFFAFGCSMTRYAWPTWADIIGNEIPKSYNFGKCGAGNLYIASQVVETHMRHKFTETDLVIIMWSTIEREDRYVNYQWKTPGSIYTQDYYSKDFVKKYADEIGYLLRDVNLISLTKGFLDNLTIDYQMLAMSPIEAISTTSNDHKKAAQIEQLYKPTFCSIGPDLLTLGMNGTWPEHPISKVGGQSADYHPSPAQHFVYLQRLYPNYIWSDTTTAWISSEQEKMEQYRDFDQMTIKSPEGTL